MKKISPGIPVRKVPRSVQFRRLKKICHALWSKAVRARDSFCILCGVSGGSKQLFAHHWIIHSRGSLGVRFNPGNGVALCYACHIFKVHQQGDARYLDQIRAYMFTNGFMDEATYEHIKFAGNAIAKVELEDLEQVRVALGG